MKTSPVVNNNVRTEQANDQHQRPTTKRPHITTNKPSGTRANVNVSGSSGGGQFSTSVPHQDLNECQHQWPGKKPAVNIIAPLATSQCQCPRPKRKTLIVNIHAPSGRRKLSIFMPQQEDANCQYPRPKRKTQIVNIHAPKEDANCQYQSLRRKTQTVNIKAPIGRR